MPRLNEIIGEKADASWAEQIDKASITRTPFWIHHVKATSYVNEQDQDVSLLVLNITVNNGNRKAPRAVITLGRTDDREGLLTYFSEDANPNGTRRDPIGPCITYEVDLKGGRSYWVLENAPDPDDQAEMFEAPKRKK